jgi:hypothetical protein
MHMHAPPQHMSAGFTQTQIAAAYETNEDVIRAKAKALGLKFAGNRTAGAEKGRIKGLLKQVRGRVPRHAKPCCCHAVP